MMSCATIAAMDAVLLYITTQDKEQASTIARALLDMKLIACANIFEHITSLYRWQGNIEQTTECVIIAKSVRARMQAITDQVKALHAYECPCIAAVPIEGYPPFLEWITRETTPSDQI